MKTTFKIQIRTQPFTPDEFYAYQALITQLSKDRVDRYEHINNLIASPTDHVFVAYLHHAIVGFVRLHVRMNGWGIEGIVDDFVVLEGHRHSGIGTALMKALHHEGGRHDVDRFYLTSSKPREDARRLYCGLGYEDKDTSVFIKKP